ncbi:putative quinone oxidoreductase [Aspergillus uvarum CBS 121591]|uniref:Putative quinone oxidoreductase n=1 Tax=Aspergillus uvarum CBS 121591 TaxID=1448315 RepID=A0A319CHC7_9EURO|nr:putative quinone oxidoreductase [Aspergillus uvarum CBS 121591]PYH78043.1 putative quinone oxidoreductase [Aspergillus uvarum CBS 121591]
MASLINQAAWQPKARTRTLQVGPGPTPSPNEHEVVIKVAYAAVNPTDWKMQDTPYFELEYPFIWGTDVAGTIVQLGSEVRQFKVGQRVIGHCDSLLTRKVTNAGFQLYTTVREILVAEIPDSLPLANAAVLPLSVSTAASALYVQLDLPFPSLSPKSTGKRIVIWGGSSSVGSSAIQLAVASGLEVVATASEANHDLVRSLGASQVFDHRNPNVIDQIASILQPGDYVVDCIGSPDTQAKCGELLGRTGGGTLPVMLWPQAELPQNVRAVFVNGLDPGMVNLDVGNAVWRIFIPEALAVGKFQAKPDPRIVPGGLEKVQEGIDILRHGVSAQKVVIEISRSE